MLQYASVFTLRQAVFFERSPAALLSKLALPGSVFHEIGRLNPFFAVLRNSQAFPMAALLHGRRSLKPSTETK